jgi:plasmid replication initiation protein
MAMALLPPDLSSRTASFTFGEFCRALGYEKGGESYRLFVKAVDECMKCVISIETGKTIRGKTAWEKYTWFSHSSYQEETGICTMTFALEFAEVMLELKRVYAKINLQDLGKLQSKYAIRYLEMAKSYESLAGKNGNRDGYWYFERTLPELRELFAITPEAYTETRDFRRKVIEKPVEELNKAGIGVAIKTTGIKQGRTLQGIRFDCARTAKTLPAKRSRGRPRKASASAAPTDRLALPTVGPARTREEKELEHLMELYQDEFTTLYAEALDAQRAQFGKILSDYMAQAAALTVLRSKYGIAR